MPHKRRSKFCAGQVRIAVTTKNGKLISDDIEHCCFLTIFELHSGKVADKRIHKTAAVSLLEDCSAIITHGLDKKTKTACDERGVRVILTGHRKANKAVRQYITKHLNSLA